MLGPEAITGSTRLKGGSATKVLLEAAFVSALNCVAAAAPPPETPTSKDDTGAGAAGSGTTLTRLPKRQRQMQPPVAGLGPAALIDAYSRVQKQVYGEPGSGQRQTLARAVAMAGAALRKREGRLVYVGVGALGVVAFVDASECPPTFGAAHRDVQAFVLTGGWDRSDAVAASLEALLGARKDGRSTNKGSSNSSSSGGSGGSGGSSSGDGDDDKGDEGNDSHGVLDSVRDLALGPDDVLVTLDFASSSVMTGRGAGGVDGNRHHPDDGVGVGCSDGCGESSAPEDFGYRAMSSSSSSSSSSKRPEFDTLVRETLQNRSGVIMIELRSQPSPAAATSGGADGAESLIGSGGGGVRGGGGGGAIVLPLDLSPLASGVATDGGAPAPASGDATVPLGLLAEFAAKLALNVISTGAHVLKGVVYHNRMVNMRVSNVKLFHRALGIVRLVAAEQSSADPRGGAVVVSESVARRALLAAIYGDDRTTGCDHGDDPSSPDVAEHISKAMNQDLVLPVAILLASSWSSSSGGGGSEGKRDAQLTAAEVRASLARDSTIRAHFEAGNK